MLLGHKQHNMALPKIVNQQCEQTENSNHSPQAFFLSIEGEALSENKLLYLMRLRV